jgi:N-methylhydantoinase A
VLRWRGAEPTLTDALVILSHLSQTALLQGAMWISRQTALHAARIKITVPLGITEMEAAWGILRVLVTKCVRAMRTITLKRGHDLRDLTLLAFGGMGLSIAGLIARELKLPNVLVPRDPGTFSMLVTDVRRVRSLRHLTRLDEDFNVRGAGMIAKPTLIPSPFEGFAAPAPIKDVAYFGGRGPVETPVFPQRA